MSDVVALPQLNRLVRSVSNSPNTPMRTISPRGWQALRPSPRRRSPSPRRSRSRSSSRSRSPSRSRSRSPSPQRQRGIPNPFLRRESANVLVYEESPDNKIRFVKQRGRFHKRRLDNKQCRQLTSHCAKRHPVRRDLKPRHTTIVMRELP